MFSSQWMSIFKALHSSEREHDPPKASTKSGIKFAENSEFLGFLFHAKYVVKTVNLWINEVWVEVGEIDPEGSGSLPETGVLKLGS